MANTLDNFSLYLWRNPEGYHVTVTTNYNLPTQKRKFFSFGKQTYKSWRAYNLYQPEPLKEYFLNWKNQYKEVFKDRESDYWVSKLAENTGTHGRRTAPGCMILFKDQERFAFIVSFADLTYKGWFDDSMLSDRQRRGAKGVCLGSYIWKDTGTITDYAEAF